jgi:EAL domain-containing protein (putative c-di-GMP-specific phosphodiesterase class I)
MFHLPHHHPHPPHHPNIPRAVDRPPRVANLDAAIPGAMLRHCLKENQGLVRILPVYPRRGGLPAMYETLLEIHPPHHPPLAPAAFIRTAREHHLLGKLDLMTLTLFRRDIFATAPAIAGMSFILNTSVASLMSKPYLSQFATPTWNSFMPALVFSLDAADLLAHSDVLPLLQRLRQTGARIATKYIGGGKTAIACAPRIGVDILRFNITDFAGRDAPHLAQLIAAANGHGLVTVIDKITTKAQHNLAMETDAACVQGPFYGAPASRVCPMPLTMP